MPESVWDYPRPPRVEPADALVTVEFAATEIASSRRTVRVLETSHPPVYYIPPDDVRWEYLTPSDRRTFCEFKGSAAYWNVEVAGRTAPDAAWSYPAPVAGYEALTDHVAFYPGKMDRCTLDDEVVQAQAGDFYGGWITGDITGPFKGAAGTAHW